MPQCEIGHIVIFRRGGEAIERGKPRIPSHFPRSGKPPLHRSIPTDIPKPGKVLLRIFDGPAAVFKQLTGPAPPV